MKLKYCKQCINYDKDSNCCVPTILSKPTNIKEIKLCPCDRLFEGKYKFQRIRDIIKIDPHYIKQLLDGEIEFPVRDKQMFKDYLQALVQQELHWTHKYLEELQELL